MAEDYGFKRQIIFSGEAKPSKMSFWMVWIWSDSIIGAYFIENDKEVTVTLNGKRFHAILTDEFLAETKAEDMENIWFQHDIDISNRVHATIDVLRPIFEYRFTYKNGVVNWHLDAIGLFSL